MKLNSFIKIIIGAAALLIVITVTIVLLFNGLTKKSFYTEDGTKRVRGISDNVNIIRDNYGVPHITASDENDLYFSLGYSHAQDRLWQMDIARRVATGKLSDIFGKDVLQIDKLFLTIGIDKTAEDIYPNLSEKSKEILKHYCDGVNFFITTYYKKLPLEFDVLNYKPELWKPEHSLMIVRLMGWELNLAWYTDYMFGEIVKKYGLEKGKDFFPDYPEDAPFIVKSDKKPNEKTKDTSSISPNNIENNYKLLTELEKGFYNSNFEYRKYFGLLGTHTGSNSWVVSGKKSESKKPILANDPHLVLQAPSKWYEVHLYNKSDNSNVCGFSIAGVPGIAIGHNDFISWGITNLMNDDADFYLLKRDSMNYYKYIYKDNSFPLDSTQESIKIKDIKDEYFFTSYKTKLGPVISDLEKTGFTDNPPYKVAANEFLVMKWTGYEFSDEINCFYKLNNAKNWNEFKDALKDFNLPASNFTYADVNGNIGYHAAGKVPVRKNMASDNSAMYPNNGETEWTGFINFDELPQSFNPKEDYIVTANNKPERDYKHYISNLYEPPYRAERIEHLLKARNNFTANEFKLIQNDVYSLQAKEFCSYIFEAFKDSLSLKPEEKEYLQFLKKWDYEMKPFSSAATLFSQFELELYKNIFLNKLGNELFDEYLFLKNIPVRTTAKLLKDSNSWMFDITGTGGKPESRNDIIKKSFRDATTALKQKYGNDNYVNWYWGDVHKVIIRHPLGIVTALSPVVNIGPFEIGGNGTTIANSEYSFSTAIKKTEFESFLGASMRFIIDMSDVGSHQSIIPGGQSGQAQHSNYRDQARLWLNGEYKKVICNNNELAKEKFKILTLIPE